MNFASLFFSLVFSRQFYALSHARLHMHSTQQDMSYNFILFDFLLKIGYVIIYFIHFFVSFSQRYDGTTMADVLRECEKIECINYLALPHFFRFLIFTHFLSFYFFCVCFFCCSFELLLSSAQRTVTHTQIGSTWLKQVYRQRLARKSVSIRFLFISFIWESIEMNASAERVVQRLK